MKKRIISFLLAGAMVFTTIPMSAMAEENKSKYGDVNEDGSVDLLDVLVLKKYLNDNSRTINMINADVNGDAAVDQTDVSVLLKYIARYVDTETESGFRTVSFYDGDRLIDTLLAKKDEPLGAVPDPAKSSKENATLLGYYLDPACTKPFYAEDPVTDNLTVYAKYQKLENQESLNITSFAQMDADPDLTFEIKKVSGGVLPENAATLTVKDGSDPVAITVTESGNGVYTVSAPEGYNKGCSYELTLADGWVFNEKESTIRTAAFSIQMDEVENLKMSDDIKYVADDEDVNYTVSGMEYDELTSELVTEDGGVIEYSGDRSPEKDGIGEGDLVCVYVGTNPLERSTDNAKELMDPAVYVKAVRVTADSVAFEPLGKNEQADLYNVPDNFPIKVDALSDADTGKVNIKDLDTDLYQEMMGEEEGTKEKALENIEAGDFITLYTSSDSVESEADVRYGQITKYNEKSGEITYEKTTEEAILSSMDLYSNIDAKGDDYITEEEKDEIEETVLAQIQESSFAEDAAASLSDMLNAAASMDAEAYALSGIEVYDAEGQAVEGGLAALNLSKKFEPAEGLDISVELIKNGEQLHYNGGVQLAVTVNGDFQAEAEEGTVHIKLGATFIQEVYLHPAVRGSIVTKKVLGFIPVPTGVEVNATVDIKSYSAVSFEAQMYTVEPEEQSTWEKLKEIFADPTEVLGLSNLPANWDSGLRTVGDVIGKIEETQEKLDQAAETEEKLEGYREDLDTLWSVVEATGEMTREDWQAMGEALGKSSIASDFMDMMDLATETGASAEYIESLEAMMDKYSETVQRESGWITLVEKEIASTEYCIYGFVIGAQTDFVVRSDMSMAIGSNLEYEVGKRYCFWFKIGLFSPSAGSSSMDLIDEHFRFQFYVMGRLGLKAGVDAKLYVGIGSGKFASAGIKSELGPYVKLYGFFIYDYEKYRSQNTAVWAAKEQKAGALYVDFGMYFILSFEANAIGKLFEYSYDFINTEIPLLEAGAKRYCYNNSYEPEDDEVVVVRDADGNSTNGIDMEAPDSIFALSYIDLVTGVKGSQVLDYNRYNVTMSNSKFKFDKDTGVISVDVPQGERYMECDMTITYLGNKLAFSNIDMSVTVPLIWTNLSTDELKEFYTASVRVGNDEDGYQTVWSTKVRKNQEFDLPSEDDIKAMLNWNDDQYIEGTGYDGQKTTGLTLIQNVTYDYHVDFREYEVTVTGIQNEDGTTHDKTYTAKYGETFDFSDLAATKTAIEGEKYTKFTELTTDAVIASTGADGQQKEEPIDLSRRIDSEMAAVLRNGITAEANYKDNGVNATFSFVGLSHENVTQLVEKGTVPSITALEEIVSDEGLAIKEITPVLGTVNGAVSYQVICGELEGPEGTINFETNGGEQITPVKKVEGSLIGTLKTPTRKGYTFGGWYSDKELTKEFKERKMPSGTTTLYAKWTANTYTVTLDVNSGNALEEGQNTRNVIYGEAYGELPQPEKSGYGFRGWYTDATGGTEITADTVYETAANQKLYAHWEELIEIDRAVFDFGEAETDDVYEKGQTYLPEYTFVPENSQGAAEDSFTVKYMRQGDSDYVEAPQKAGTYNVTISRPGDNTYAKFEQTYEAVLTIQKADRTIEPVGEVTEAGYTYLTIDGSAIDDLDPNAVLSYSTNNTGKGENYRVTTSLTSGRAERLTPETTYDVNVTITGDENYNDVTEALFVKDARTKAKPTESWADHANTDWYNDTDTTFTLTEPEQLAGLAVLVKDGNSFSGKTVTIGADMDLSAYQWEPIGDGRLVFQNYRFYQSQWSGTLNGQNHKLTGIIGMGEGYIGLTGFVYKGSVYNIFIDDSYFSGESQVGSVVGRLDNSYTGNNISYAVVDGSENIGGIVGLALWSTAAQCEFYGRAYGADFIGGIVGYSDCSNTRNCADFGVIYGGNNGSRGGIVGRTQHSDTVYNCYHIGIVSTTGGSEHTGAIVGYVEKKSKSTGNVAVDQCYFLEGSAEGKDAIGKVGKKGLSSQKTASFSGPGIKMYDDCETGTSGWTLVDKLNHWTQRVDDYKCDIWEVKNNKSYPTIIGLPRK